MKKRIDFILVVLLILLLSGVNNTSERLIKMHHREFNVVTYGAKGDGVTDDTDAMQACIDAAEATLGELWPDGNSPGATVYVPSGIYITSDSLVITGYRISLRGDGMGSIIKSEASGGEAVLRFRDCAQFRVNDIVISGNGGWYGDGATNGNGIELVNSTDGSINNVTIEFNGGHGVYTTRWCFGLFFYNTFIKNNAGDGMHFVDGGDPWAANGATTHITNSTLSWNADDGLEWCSSGLSVIGCDIEGNWGSGIQIGSGGVDALAAVGVEITGNYFEWNDSSAIKFIVESTNVTVEGVVVEGNYFFQNNTQGDLSVITSEVYGGGTFNHSLKNVRIGINVYRLDEYVTDYIDLPSAARTCVIVYPPKEEEPASIIDYTYGTTLFRGVPYAKTFASAIVEGDGITNYILSPVIQSLGSSAIDISANPQIVNGFFDNQEIKIRGHSDANTLTLDDGNGLQLTGGEQCVLGVGDIIALMWSSSLGVWTELYRSDN